MGLANKMAPGVAEGKFALNTNLDSKTFYHIGFSKKRGLKPLKIAF